MRLTEERTQLGTAGRSLLAHLGRRLGPLRQQIGDTGRAVRSGLRPGQSRGREIRRRFKRKPAMLPREGGGYQAPRCSSWTAPKSTCSSWAPAPTEACRTLRWLWTAPVFVACPRQPWTRHGPWLTSSSKEPKGD